MENFQTLPFPAQEYPRKFIPQDLNLMDWAQLEPCFEQIHQMPLRNPQEAETMILAWGELSAAILEWSSRLYVNTTCDTRSEFHTQQFSHFVEAIEPQLAPWEQKLKTKFLAQVPAEWVPALYQNWLRDLKTESELFRQENIPVFTEIQKEVQRYQQCTGSLSVFFEGEEKTLSRMSVYMESSDRTVRENAWRAIWGKRLEVSHTLNDHFDKLFELRGVVAKNCGYPSFVPYIFTAKGRYDYTPEDCERFHASVEELVVPRYRKLMERRKQELGLQSLRPWDLACDPKGRAPLKPFAKIEDLTTKVGNIFAQIDPRLGAYFTQMQERKLLDLENRMGKAPGGYQTALDENRLPFIFMNAVGLHSDVTTLLHEAGHSFHQFCMKNLPVPALRNISSEIAEVASMSMELVGNDFLSEFYSGEDLTRARLGQWEDSMRILPWAATIDAFQLWMYRNPNHTHEERNAYWCKLEERFGVGLDWSGLEEFRNIQWQRQLHLFEVPFYYIEYAMAQLGAYQVYRNYKANPKQAIEDYLQGLALGSTRPLPELFAGLNIRFDFSQENLKPLMEMVDAEIAQIEGAKHA
jgi:oligoendopeptidase F